MTDLFDFGPSKKLFAVVGNPVSHSKSPRVHAMFAEQCGIDLEYHAIHVEVGGFEQAVSGFQASGGQGLNVTVPFKANACKLADALSERARLAGAVNTLVLKKDIFGDNTDGLGFVADIESNLNASLDQALILMIGAGGAAQGVLGPMLKRKPQQMVVANRTKDKAVQLVQRFQHLGAIKGCGLDELEGAQFDIVINASSASLAGALPAVPDSVFNGVRLAYDMAYGSEPTPFQLWAKGCGAQRSVDGLGMLVEQAAESFKIWHGIRPETAAVIETLRKPSD